VTNKEISSSFLPIISRNPMSGVRGRPYN